MAAPSTCWQTWSAVEVDIRVLVVVSTCFNYFWNFHPKNWGRCPIWRAYFSNGLVQPPTRCEFPSTIIWSSFDGGSTWQKESVSGSDRAWWSDIEVTSDGSLVVAIETGTLIGSYGDIGVFHKGWPTTTSTSSTAALRIWAACGCSKILAYVFIATDGIRSWPDLSLDHNGNSVAL